MMKLKPVKFGRKIFKKLMYGYKTSVKPPKELPPEIQILGTETKPLVMKGRMEVEPKKEKVMLEGLKIPGFIPKKITTAKTAIKAEERISLAYPLIPKKPAKGEPVFAYAKIAWDPKSHRYLYQVIEPELSKKMKEIFTKLKDLLEQRLEVDFTRLKKYEAVEYLHKQVGELLTYMGVELTESEKQILYYYIDRDFIGLERIEPLMQDEQIEDISCDGVNVPVFVFHRNPILGSVITNVVYDDPNHLDSFIIRLAQLCGKSISILNPLLNGALPDGSRIQATLATDIARRGSNFTIRKFTEKPLTPVHLLNYGTVDAKILAFLWLAVDFGKSILISGGTAAGKTSLLNVISLFIRPDKKIVSIEDTAELKLPHPHWIPHVARVPIAMGPEGRLRGEIDLFDLLRESFRQRPDYIIVGEVRGKEAFVLFQEMASGHPSLATIHAENAPKLMDRLMSPPISLPPALIETLDLIVFLLSTRYKERQVRRVTEIYEVVGINPKEKMPIVNPVFRWNAMNDTFDIVGDSVLLKRIAQTKGMTEHQIIEELERRMIVLNWMQENNIMEYKDVYHVVNLYYNYPERVLAAATGG